MGLKNINAFVNKKQHICMSDFLVVKNLLINLVYLVKILKVGNQKLKGKFLNDQGKFDDKITIGVSFDHFFFKEVDLILFIVSA